MSKKSKAERITTAEFDEKFEAGDITEHLDHSTATKTDKTVEAPSPADAQREVDAIGMVYTSDGWIYARFRIPLAFAVERSEPTLKGDAVNLLKIGMVRIATQEAG